MGFYAQRILPWLIHLAMGNRKLNAYREQVICGACGTVLEVGIGSGRNLPFYGVEVDKIIGLDPSAQLLDLARETSRDLDFDVELLEGSAESIPLGDDSMDTLVMTWTLCSIPDASRALAEMRRVLRRHGQLLFVEHGLAPEENVQRCQHRLDPWWWRVSCHLYHPMDKLIIDAGFRIEKLETGYLGAGPKTMTFMYEGAAVCE